MKIDDTQRSAALSSYARFRRVVIPFSDDAYGRGFLSAGRLGSCF